ncbi:hypothetical protein QFC20_006765 [Naganishia adeliensis]|uniref:Uncharacterized protein n=1 Tax=Naganishia adeliensis TaxID=92952 RepID=A0ACC2V710_9TREE|nr:hypothetical protein QFC20_006765 [Naganishia adeliensis]
MFTIIGEFLIGENKFGTLANLNATTHLIREATNAVLWTTVMLDTITPRWNAILEKARSESDDISDREARLKMAELKNIRPDSKQKAARSQLTANTSSISFGRSDAVSRRIFSHWDFQTSHCASVMATNAKSTQAVSRTGSSYSAPELSPIRRVIESWDRSAPLVSMPCYLSALQIHNSAYFFEDGRVDSQDFDSEKIILRPYRTLVQFHGPKQQRSRNTEVKDLDPERAQRNARTLLDLIKVAGRFGSVTDSTSSGPSSTPVRNGMEDREAHMYLDLNAPAHIAATLNKEELDEMVNRLPEVVQACPDILRSRLFVSSKDAASPESLLSAIKQFQACYADFPDLTPCRPSLVVEPVRSKSEFAANIISGIGVR